MPLCIDQTGKFDTMTPNLVNRLEDPDGEANSAHSVGAFVEFWGWMFRLAWTNFCLLEDHPEGRHHLQFFFKLQR